MNSTCGSTPPNPNPDLPNRSTNLNKTLGMIGTPHEESITMILSTKRGLRKHPKKTTKRGLRKSPQRTTGNNTTRP
jgi:hypothetical protein